MRPGPPGGRLLHHVAAALGSASDLVLPRTCAGCACPGHRWCGACAGALAGTPLLRTLADGTPVWSAAAYEGAVREAVNAWKDHDRADLSAVLGTAVAAVYLAAGAPADVLVPVPSSAAARRRRGREPVRELSRVAARELAREPGTSGPRVLAVLRHQRGVADQSGLGASARAANLSGAVAVAPGLRGRVSGRRLLLVDDVVTSGATLFETARALAASGGHVVGALTVAATPRRRAGPDG